MQKTLTFETPGGHIQLFTNDIKSTSSENGRVFIKTYQDDVYQVLGGFSNVSAMIQDAHAFEPKEYYVCHDHLITSSLHVNLETNSKHYIPCDMVKTVTEINGKQISICLKDNQIIKSDCTAREFFKSRTTME